MPITIFTRGPSLTHSTLSQNGWEVGLNFAEGATIVLVNRLSYNGFRDLSIKVAFLNIHTAKIKFGDSFLPIEWLFNPGTGLVSRSSPTSQKSLVTDWIEK